MRKWLPLMTVCLGTFMLLIDVTIVNVALPDMAGDLKTVFRLRCSGSSTRTRCALRALVLGTGSIADRVGHRRAYIAGLALFAAASFVCGIAPNSGALIAARAVQGIGGAAMFATTFALLNSDYPGRDRGTAYGMWGAVAGRPRRSVRSSAGCSPRPCRGGGSSSSTCRSACIAIVLCVTRSRCAWPGPVTGRHRRHGAVHRGRGRVTYGLIGRTSDGWSDVRVVGRASMASGVLLVCSSWSSARTATPCSISACCATAPSSACCSPDWS